MESKYFENFVKTRFVRVNKLCYSVEKLTPEGILFCHLLDVKGYPRPGRLLTQFDLNKTEVHEIGDIGPQPGWDLQF